MTAPTKPRQIDKLTPEAAEAFAAAIEQECKSVPEHEISYRLPGGVHLRCEYRRPLVNGRRRADYIVVEQLAYRWEYETRDGERHPVFRHSAVRLLAGEAWEVIESERMADVEAMFGRWRRNAGALPSEARRGSYDAEAESFVVRGGAS